MSVDVVSDKIHSRHDPKWSGRLGPAEGGGLLVCVACVIEMIESDDVAVCGCFMFNVEKVLTTDYNVFLNTLLCQCSLVTAAIFVLQSVKKSFALSGVSEVLKCSPGALRNLLRQDQRVSLRFTASLFSKCLFSKECVMVTILDTKNKTYLCNYKYIFQYTELITIFPY